MDGVRGAAAASEGVRVMWTGSGVQRLQVRGFELCGRGPECSAASEGVRVVWTGSGVQRLQMRGFELYERGPGCSGCK